LDSTQSGFHFHGFFAAKNGELIMRPPLPLDLLRRALYSNFDWQKEYAEAHAALNSAASAY
jgi:hypothetical protein